MPRERDQARSAGTTASCRAAVLFENQQAALTADEGGADPRRCAVRPARLVLIEQSDPRQQRYGPRAKNQSRRNASVGPSLSLSAWARSTLLSTAGSSSWGWRRSRIRMASVGA